MQRFRFIFILLWSLLNFDDFLHGSTLSPRQNSTVTIAVLGRSGPEISSTVNGNHLVLTNKMWKLTLFNPF